MTCRRGSCWKERERSKRCRVPVADQGGKRLQIFQARLAPVIEFEHHPAGANMQNFLTCLCILSNKHVVHAAPSFP
jgi:hypothetical protein